MKLSHFKISVLVLLFLILAPTISLACDCPTKPEMKEAAEAASVIFVGNVERITEDPLRPNFKKVEIKPFRQIKGFEEFSPKIVVLYTPKEKCSFDFQVAGDYLVYAVGSMAKLKVNNCSRTAYFDHVREEVTKVDELLNYEIVEEIVEEVVVEKPKKPKPISKPTQIGF